MAALPRILRDHVTAPLGGATGQSEPLESEGGMVGCGGCEANLAGLSNIELLPAFVQEAPACSLDSQNHALRAREFRAVFAWLRSAERDGPGFRWTFQNGPGVERRVRELARLEHACCPFLSFAISTRGDEVVWQARGHEGTEALVAAFFDLPESLKQAERPFDGLVLRLVKPH
jgi:hypothetical protein